MFGVPTVRTGTVFAIFRRKEPELPRAKIGPQQLESIFPEFNLDVPMPRSTKIPARVIIIPAPEEPDEAAGALSGRQSSSG